MRKTIRGLDLELICVLEIVVNRELSPIYFKLFLDFINYSNPFIKGKGVNICNKSCWIWITIKKLRLLYLPKMWRGYQTLYMGLASSCMSSTSGIGTMNNFGKGSYEVFCTDMWPIWVEIQTQSFLLVHLTYVLIYTQV